MRFGRGQRKQIKQSDSNLKKKRLRTFHQLDFVKGTHWCRFDGTSAKTVPSQNLDTVSS